MDFDDPLFCLRWATVFAAMATLQLSIEQFVDRSIHQRHGFLGWPVAVLRRGRAKVGTFGRVLRAIYGDRAIAMLFASRALAAIVLLAPVPSPVGSVLIPYLFATHLLLQFHSYPMSGDGSFMGHTLVWGTLTIAAWTGHHPEVPRLCLYFLGFHCCASYFWPGVRKLLTPEWRSGEAMRVIACHSYFGSRPLAACFRRFPWLAPIATIVTWTMETAFPVALVVGSPGVWVFIAWAWLFHAGNVYLLGVTRFFWIWPASYGAVVFTARSVEAAGWSLF